MPSSLLPSPYPSAGDIIDGKYQIERVIGEGGMGCVARAYHLLLRAPVALKFMNPQFMTFPGAVERFINEGIASKKIRSDHVVPVEDVGKLAGGAPYLVMPCLEGVDLAELLARDGTPGLPIPRAIHFVLQVLRGLQAAHAAGIIHRDMKPSNCFVVKNDGVPDFVRILDFGISKVVEPGSASLTQTNSALGTPLYMSPEQARSPRDVDGRSDIYSVGVILYELLTGHTPFFSERGEFAEILFKLFTTDAPPVQSTQPDIPDALAAVVHTALARDAADRYFTAQEMATAIAPFADERSAGIASRIESYVPDSSMTMPPPADMAMPASIVAFSQLDAGRATDLMASRPKTAVQKGMPLTKLMDHAPGMSGPKPSFGRLSARPLDPAARASDEEAVASTQFGQDALAPKLLQTRSQGAGVSTDLGAASDQAPAYVPEGRSSLRFLVPGAAVVAMVGVAMILVSVKKPPVVASPPPQIVISAPPVALLPASVAPLRSATLPVMPSASTPPSASAAPRSPLRPTSSTPGAPRPYAPPNVLDTPIKN